MKEININLSFQVLNEFEKEDHVQEYFSYTGLFFETGSPSLLVLSRCNILN